MSDPREALGALARAAADIAARGRRNAEVGSYYGALKRTRRLTQVLLAEYRCERGCLLLVVFQTTMGPAYYRPTFRLNPAESERRRMRELRPGIRPERERSNLHEGVPIGEVRDGKWNARSGYLEDLVSITLRCEHGQHEWEGEIPYGEPGAPNRETIL